MCVGAKMDWGFCRARRMMDDFTKRPDSQKLKIKSKSVWV